jgi:hypothetical protein
MAIRFRLALPRISDEEFGVRFDEFFDFVNEDAAANGTRSVAAAEAIFSVVRLRMINRRFMKRFAPLGNV